MKKESPLSFADVAIVACGTLSPELNHLRKIGFLDSPHVFYTRPGLHENPKELKAQLISRVMQAQEASGRTAREL